MAKFNPLALTLSPGTPALACDHKAGSVTLSFPSTLGSKGKDRGVATKERVALPSLDSLALGKGTQGRGRNNLFNLKSFNELKKDQTNIKIFKNSSFDSSFNSVKSLNTNLSNLLLLPSPVPCATPHPLESKASLPKAAKPLGLRSEIGGEGYSPSLPLGSPSFRRALAGDGWDATHSLDKVGSAILRAIRTIRLNRDEWKLIRYINLMENKSFYIKQNNKIFSYNNIISKNILLRNMKYNFLKSTLSSILKKKIRRISEILEDKPIKNYVLYSYLNFCIFTPPHLNVPALDPALAGTLALDPLGLLRKGGGPCPWQGRAKLSLNKDKGRKFGSFINYNKIIGYKFNSTFYQAYPNCWAPFAPPALPLTLPNPMSLDLKVKARGGKNNCSLNPLPPFSLTPALDSLGLQLSPLARLRKGKGPLSKGEGELEKSIGNIYIKDTYKLLFYLFKSMYCLISKPVLKYTNDKVTIQLFYYLNIPKKKVFRLFSIFYINSIKKKWLAHIEKKKTNFISLPLPSQGQGTSLALGTKEGGALETLRSTPSFGQLHSFPALLQNKALGHALADLEGGVDPKELVQSKGVDLLPIGGRTFLPRGNTKIYIRWKLRKAISRFKFKIQSNPAKAATGGGSNKLFQLRKFNLTAKAVFQNKFKLICAILSNKFNKPVELQLIRLHHPYHDSNILVNLLSLNIKNKRKKARVAIQKIYNKKPVKFLNDPNLKKPALPMAESQDLGLKARGTGNLTPAFLSGLNIKIAGRLMGEPIIPKITTKVFGKGASAIGKVNYLDVARITKKNRKGAYTIKITSGQNFF
jgi:hypothetical protein